MYLKKFRKAGGRLTAYPLHKVVCACEDSVLMILRNLLKMLPKRIGVMIAPLAIARNCARTGRKLLQFPGVNLLICQWLADDLADLAGNLCKGVFSLAVERIDFAPMLFRRKKNVADDSGLILSWDGSVPACSKRQSKRSGLD